MYHSNCKICQEKIWYESSKVAMAAERAGRKCKKCRELQTKERRSIGLERNCPKCNDIITYGARSSCRAAEKSRLLCSKCCRISEHYSGLTRICPECKTKLTYKTADSVTRANKANDVCKSCSLKGRAPSPQCIAAMVEANTGCKRSLEHMKAIIDANTGIKRSDETKKKMSVAQTGRTFSKESLLKMSISRLGKFASDETRRKLRIYHAGVYGRSPDWEAPFTSGELKTWATRAKRKFSYCQKCNATERLHAHHIKPKCMYPELALDPENAMILCERCHIEHHKINGHKN